MSLLNGHTPRLTPQISFGNILTMLMILLGGFGGFLRYEHRLTTLEERISVATRDTEHLRAAVVKLTEATTDNSRTLAERSQIITDVYRRLSDIERRIDGRSESPRPPY